MSNCTDCQVEITSENAYKKSGRPGKYISRCKSCFNKYCMKRWIQRKLNVIEQKGNRCEDCKQSYHYSVYDFHHLNPTEKDMQWDKMRLMNEAKMQQELSKCILLCSNCHRIRHHSN